MAYIKQIKTGDVTYDLRAKWDQKGNVIDTSYLKLTGGTLTGALSVNGVLSASNNLIVNGTTTLNGATTSNSTLHLTNPSDAGYGTSVAVFGIGPLNSTNMQLDGNEIFVQNNGAQSILYLNKDATAWEGRVQTGSHLYVKHDIQVGSETDAATAGPMISLRADKYFIGLHIGTGTSGNRGIYDWGTTGWLLYRTNSNELKSQAHSPNSDYNLRHIGYGTGVPSNSAGSNGDIYIRYL